MLDELSMTVLFTLLDNILPDNRFGEKELINTVSALRPDKLSSGMIERAIDNLVNKALIYRETGNKWPWYGVKSLAYITIMFENIFSKKSNEAEKQKKLRCSLINNTLRLKLAIKYERSKQIIEEIIKDINDSFKVGKIYYNCFNLNKYGNSGYSNSDYIFQAVNYFKQALVNEKPDSNRYTDIINVYLSALLENSILKKSWQELINLLNEIGDDWQDCPAHVELALLEQS
jgi:hypothetical protein